MYMCTYHVVIKFSYLYGFLLILHFMRVRATDQSVIIISFSVCACIVHLCVDVHTYICIYMFMCV